MTVKMRSSKHSSKASHRKTSPTFEVHWQGNLKDYITALDWSADRKTLAVSSASGEVALWSTQSEPTDEIQYLYATSSAARLDCLRFSAEGHYLAAAGQQGQVLIWSIQDLDQPIMTLDQTLDQTSAWIDHLAWHPKHPWLAFGAGRQVKVWDAAQRQWVTEQDFADSSVLDLSWHPQGKLLAVSGHNGVKVWSQEDWTLAPTVTEVPGASVSVDWSWDGQYLASGNLDRTLTVVDWETPPPWLMQGFPGKVRQVTWAPVLPNQPPKVAAACADGITIWTLPEKTSDNRWQNQVLQKHHQTVVAIAFHPTTHLLASAAQDGNVCLWHQAKSLHQTLKGISKGFSALAWHPEGTYLAAGGDQGEIIIWKPSNRGTGFGAGN